MPPKQRGDRAKGWFPPVAVLCVLVCWPGVVLASAFGAKEVGVVVWPLSAVTAVALILVFVRLRSGDITKLCADVCKAVRKPPP